MATSVLSLPTGFSASLLRSGAPAARSAPHQQRHLSVPRGATWGRDLRSANPGPAVVGSPALGKSGLRQLRTEAKAGSTKTYTTTVVPEPDFRIPVVLLGTAAALIALDQKLVAAPIGLLGGLLAFQATRVRFLFNEDSLEVVIGEKAESSGENVFVGGENKWKYETFTNWEFWWPGFPVLVYFKETQTKPEGQIHFFPIIADGKKLYDVMVERCGPSQNSGPKNE